MKKKQEMKNSKNLNLGWMTSWKTFQKTIVIWDGDKKLSKINSSGRDIWKKVSVVEDRAGMDFKEFSLQ